MGNENRTGGVTCKLPADAPLTDDFKYENAAEKIATGSDELVKAMFQAELEQLKEMVKMAQ